MRCVTLTLTPNSKSLYGLLLRHYLGPVNVHRIKKSCGSRPLCGISLQSQVTDTSPAVNTCSAPAPGPQQQCVDFSVFLQTGWRCPPCNNFMALFITSMLQGCRSRPVPLNIFAAWPLFLIRACACPEYPLRKERQKMPLKVARILQYGLCPAHMPLPAGQNFL